jgi:hypothetical protein
MPTKHTILVTGFSIWTRSDSSKIWFEAGKKWANAIVNYDAWALAKLIAVMAPNPAGAILSPLVMTIARWHASKLKKKLGPNGIWVGVDPRQFVGNIENSIEWWKHVDARPRTNSNKQKEPVPW